MTERTVRATQISLARFIPLPPATASFFSLSATQKRVLETIWRHGAISRVDIAKATGLTGASATRLVRDLEERGLTVDRVQHDGARGQPSRPVSLAADGAYALGVNFSHGYVDVGLISLAGDMAGHERIALAEPTPHQVGAIAAEAFERLRRRTGVPLKRTVGAGFSVPGDFISPNRLNAHAYFPAFADVDVQAVFAEHMPLPVVIENDAASAALGERVHGLGRRFDSFMLVHVGHGIGSGLVLGGQLHRGFHTNAGLLGVAFPMDRPRPSGQDLFAILAAAGIAANDFDVLDSLDLEEPAVSSWLDRAGAQLAEGLDVPVRMIDPQAVILGGRLPPRFLEALYQRTPLVKVLDRSKPLPTPTFAVSELGAFAGVIGAASACFFHTFFAA